MVGLLVDGGVVGAGVGRTDVTGAGVGLATGGSVGTPTNE